MILGYGGRFEVGVTTSGSRVVPDPQWLTVINAPLDGYISGGGELEVAPY